MATSRPPPTRAEPSQSPTPSSASPSSSLSSLTLVNSSLGLSSTSGRMWGGCTTREAVDKCEGLLQAPPLCRWDTQYCPSASYVIHLLLSVEKCWILKTHPLWEREYRSVWCSLSDSLFSQEKVEPIICRYNLSGFKLAKELWLLIISIILVRPYLDGVGVFFFFGQSPNLLVITRSPCS